MHGWCDIGDQIDKKEKSYKDLIFTDMEEVFRAALVAVPMRL